MDSAGRTSFQRAAQCAGDAGAGGSPMVDRSPHRWPRLDYADWSEAALTLQLWTQVVGKIRLALTPWLNHSWQTPLYVTARGLGTSPIPIGNEIFEIEFDFIAHRLSVRTSRG